MSVESLIPLRTHFSELGETTSQSTFLKNIKAISNVYRMVLSGQGHQKLQLDVTNGEPEGAPLWCRYSTW